jgi:hypothetical protein
MEARDCSLHPDTCGSLCDVVSASKYEIVCDTRPANDISVDQTKVIDMQVDWNYEPFYFQCASSSCKPPGCVLPTANASACEFAYTAKNTPRLVYEPPSYIAAGDVLTFKLRHRTESLVQDFDWFTAGEGPRPRPGDLRLGGPDDLALTMTVTLGEAACTQIKIDEQYDELKCLLDVDAAPETGAVPRVFVEGYGNAEIRDDDDTRNPTGNSSPSPPSPPSPPPNTTTCLKMSSSSTSSPPSHLPSHPRPEEMVMPPLPRPLPSRTSKKLLPPESSRDSMTDNHSSKLPER